MRAAYWLAPRGSLAQLLSYRTTSLVVVPLGYQGPSTCLGKHFLYWGFLLLDDSSLCQIDKTEQNTHQDNSLLLLYSVYKLYRYMFGNLSYVSI